MPEPLHTVRIPTRWGDQDALNHVNNAVYFTYIEQARIDWLIQLGGQMDSPQGPIVADIGCAFKRPVKHPATVIVRLFVERVGRASVNLRHVITIDGDEDTVYAEGVAVLVWVDYARGRPIQLPDELRKVLASADGA